MSEIISRDHHWKAYVIHFNRSVCVVQWTERRLMTVFPCWWCFLDDIKTSLPMHEIRLICPSCKRCPIVAQQNRWRLTHTVLLKTLFCVSTLSHGVQPSLYEVRQVWWLAPDKMSMSYTHRVLKPYLEERIHVLKTPGTLASHAWEPDNIWSLSLGTAEREE